ncbi:MAG TPA: ECF-type sigma factor [Verrucomicrobiae bacterium]|nr:ECF-type sigma factor [Verrucomicrobiae bacterium]
MAKITVVRASANTPAPDQLVAENYDEFRRVARGVLNGDAQKLQIQPTDLAHAAAIKLFALNRIELNGRTHFLSLSARIMRQILMDEVRRVRAAKRQAPPVTTQWPGDGGAPLDLEALDSALTKLEGVSPELARLVEQRFFAGLTVQEIAAIDGVSESTIKRQWRAARAWLVNEMQLD